MDNMDAADDPIDLHSCGFLIFRHDETGWQFLLMRHTDRWDLPKGLVESNETPIATAFRELNEETGIPESEVRLIEDFRFSNRYQVTGFDGKPARKQLTIYLGVVRGNPKIELTEHVGYQWFEWRPPHQLEPKNVDQVLAAVERYGWPKSSSFHVSS